MDNLRFSELINSVIYGGLPDISREKLTQEQKDQLIESCQNRADASIAYAESAVVSDEDESTEQ
jgi:hypothetical protein